MLSLLGLLAGLLLGSFLNVCIYRWPRDLSILRPQRSFCPHCERTIAWYDNIPVLSYLWLRGRCRHCGGGIPWRYPVVELLTGVLFAVSLARLGPTWAALKSCTFSFLLVGLFFADLEELILPDELTKSGMALGVLFSLVVPLPVLLTYFVLPRAWDLRWFSLAESVLAAAVCSGILWGTGALYKQIRHREGLGFGDVKLVAMIGAFLGLAGVLQTLMLGSIAGAVVGLTYLLWTKKDMSTYELPFGSFLAAAALVTGLITGPAAPFAK